MSRKTGLERGQPIHIPFARGLDTKSHGYLVEPPGLTICRDVLFDEVGGLGCRPPYIGIGTNIYGGGSLANARKLTVVGDELLCWTIDTLYSWSETLTAWVSRGTHLAVATTEESVFGNTTDQVFADRAQLGNVIVYVWTEAQAGATASYLAARDATTGATLIAPTAFGAGASRPRVVALDTVIAVYWVLAGSGLVVGSVTPSAPAFAAGILAIVSANENNYDVVRDPGADRAVAVTRLTAGTSYTVARVTAAGAVTSSTKVRAADGMVAVACTSTVIQIVRQDGTNIVGDQLVMSSLADTYTAQAIGSTAGSTAYQLTAAFRSVTTGGYYRCYIYWSQDETDLADPTSAGVWYNWANTNNAVGATTALVIRNGLASRAFDYNGSVYVWTAFAQANNAAASAAVGVLGYRVPVQNSNVLFRDDGEFYAKAAWRNAGGFGYYTGHLPGVALVSGTTGFAVATTVRAFTALGGYIFDTQGYGARSPRDVVFTFDSDSARRMVTLGRTSYISGGVLLQYDGEGLTEVGFTQFPWYINVTTGAAGASVAGAYSFESSFRSENARGEVERSTTAIGQQYTIAVTKKFTVPVSQLRMTRKQGSRRAVAVEVWRTQINPTDDAPYYLVTSRDPNATGDNGYLANSTTGSTAANATLTDNMVDSVATGLSGLVIKEQHPENGNVLPRFAPPPATIMAVGESRLFLAGVPGEPTRIWYSLLRNVGEVAAFHPALVIDLPATTGAVTALAVLDGVLVAWTATACYALAGDGFTNLGAGSNYGPARLLSADLGASSQDTVALTPRGLVFFSRKGWYLLGKGWDLTYIGAAVEDFNTDTWVAAQTVESQHHVRVLSASRMLVWDYLVDQWSEWTITGGRALAMWRTFPMLLTTFVAKPSTDFSSAFAAQDVEMIIRPAGIQGFARVWRVMVLGSFGDEIGMRVRIAFNYAATYTDDKSMAFADLAAGAPVQLQHGPSQQRVEAMRVRVTVTPQGGAAMPITLVGLSLEVGIKPGLYQRLPTASQQ